MPRALSNPPNPWSTTHVDWLGDPPAVQLQVYEEQARSIVSKNDSPDVPFTYSINPYRGCFHACAYCYARPSHQYLGFGAGTDFERSIVVKVNAPSLLRRTFASPRWQGEAIAFSGVTDCYQPLEASYGITRALLEVCLEHRNPVGVITKGALVERDVDVLGELARVARCHAFVSLPFLDDESARAMEPFAASPTRRLRAVERLSAAGITTGVAIAPVIPGLNDAQIPEILARAKDAGASRAFMILLRLPAEVAPVFEERLRESLPGRADKVLHAIEDMRGGRRNDPRFGTRMRGSGPRWDAIVGLFDAHRRRLGYVDDDRYDDRGEPSPFRRPSAQGELF